MQVGDCVLEVNGEDVVGQKIGEIAARVRSRPDTASLLVWNCGVEDTCDPEVKYFSCFSTEWSVSGKSIIDWSKALEETPRRPISMGHVTHADVICTGTLGTAASHWALMRVT